MVGLDVGVVTVSGEGVGVPVSRGFCVGKVVVGSGMIGANVGSWVGNSVVGAGVTGETMGAVSEGFCIGEGIGAGVMGGKVGFGASTGLLVTQKVGVGSSAISGNVGEGVIPHEYEYGQPM
jgi:hypothetical protein